jgi:hypothetical protein
LKSREAKRTTIFSEAPESMDAAQNDNVKEVALSMTVKRPDVVASFSGYAPPFDVAPIVERMLASVPPKYLIGLKEVVLTNSSGLPRKLRRSGTKARKRKVRIVETLGLYHPAWRSGPAWIEIFVDNTLKRSETRWLMRLNFLREAKIADVLFHEIGHHIHFATHPEYREKEDVADVWKVRLKKQYLRIRHPILKAIFYPLRPFTRVLGKLVKKKMFNLGMISRAEFEEDSKGH